ncbi:hypothetical protein SteCoe_24228 [Stentor coeruleus]|uniref:Uncharacterized protein n=1 Tax=Stentor coeruleus TaxID=5963 RepID=A0A1R2BHY7_9CILI|nr:hypothetical protein SteCoe_24228 [Stentor coeruleus]
MLTSELYDKSFEDLLKSLKVERNKKIRHEKIIQRIAKLSTPKKQQLDGDDEDTVGPGRYNPKDNFLSTKTNSPSATIGKSNRFKHSKLYPLKLIKSNNFPQNNLNKSLGHSETFSTPSYSFKGTGHDLKLVNNPNVPGVGKYYLRSYSKYKAYSFNKSKRNFDWKKDIQVLQKLVEFDRKYS